jgi:transcriptional antiterminator RfaH
MASRWFVLVSKLGKESLLVNRLRSQGYEVFYPQRGVADGKAGRNGSQGLFPGYLFIRLDLNRDSLSTFQHMAYCEGLVSFGLRPAYVPDELVAAMQRRTDVASAAGIQQQGLFVDERLSSAERVRELMTLLQGMSLSSSAEQ